MDITILIPHYKNGKATAYAIAQLIKHKGGHNQNVVVIDNSNGEGLKYVAPFLHDITLRYYQQHTIQSHGLAYDYAIMKGDVKTEYFITMESDSFPVSDTWLDYYENLIDEGYEFAASQLHLSGGVFGHPAGALYKMSNWKECKEYVMDIKYKYFPNMSKREGFDCHIMIREDILSRVLVNPDDYFELADSYRPYTKDKALNRLEDYRPIAQSVFHNGMGGLNESVKSYGERHIAYDAPAILMGNKKHIINRIGYEPGQFFCYWHYVMNKKIHPIPTEIKWMEGREFQQQEHTFTENGFKHIWCGSSFLDMRESDNYVYEFKKNQIDELYNSLPDKYKVNEVKVY